MCSYHIFKSLILCILSVRPISSFSTSGHELHWHHKNSNPNRSQRIRSTELGVKWFGGSKDNLKGDELLGVKIERTSPNSRRIAGEIIISRPMDDVWAILTDYDNLAIHVPNLVESRRVGPDSSDNTQGDGNYKCKLYQKAAQKIVGFDFRASVTMDMAEKFQTSNVVTPRVMKLGREKKIPVGEQRKIQFKCVESQFFSEFDGEWKCSWIDDPNDAFELATKVEYIVDVRPRGPVPVQALEWRIREDVPTNLRGVKMASIKSGLEGVMKLRGESSSQSITMKALPDNRSLSDGRNDVVRRRNIQSISNVEAQIVKADERRSDNRTNTVQRKINSSRKEGRAKMPVHVKWYDDETMATYLDESN